ncbi:MAG: GNAT family N-acetyltransferase [Sphingobacteriales bacterium]|nr:MAG: GNAT family N-acetyltransferase [Sphingobacteriales bacterium]
MIEIIHAGIDDIAVIRRLAEEIWFPTYLPILPEGQADYMFGKFYTIEALREQMQQDGHSFLLAYDEGVPAGFASYSLIATDIVKLHKLYVLPSTQGRGIGAALLDQVSDEARKLSATKLILYVNKYNHSAQKFYERKGLRIFKSEIIEIGQEFVMDDYVLELNL